MADFITPTELVVKLDLPDGSQPTDRATQATAGASAAIREACGWHIWPVATNLTFTDFAAGDVVLPALQVAVTSVTVNGLLQPPSAYVVNAATGLLAFAPYLRLSGPLVITYGAGYSTVPEAVRDICLDEAVARYGNPENVREDTIGGTAMTYNVRPDLDSDSRLRAYRLGPAI